MRRLPIRFFVIVTSIALLGYAYLAARLAGSLLTRLTLAVPFLLIWAMPIFHWGKDRADAGWGDRAVQWGSYLSMGLLSFLLVAGLARDLALLLTLGFADAPWRLALAGADGAAAATLFALLLTAAGTLVAYTGPRIRHVDLPLAELPPALDGFRIAQISDLHIGPTIRVGYVSRVVRLTNGLGADLVALTGDIFDGSVAALAAHATPLAQLAQRGRVCYVPGNHEYYWDAAAWSQWCERHGMAVLLNRGILVDVGGASLLVAGVTDPAARFKNQGPLPDPALAAAAGQGAAVRLLLAHQPQIAEAAAAAGFDVQLSGHTHAGQFFPWTLVVRFVHRHYAGLGKCGRMWVYVSPGTGTWGPPVRLGTVPEITLLRLVKA